MFSSHVLRSIAGVFWVIVGIAGFLLAFDSLLFVIAVVALLVAGGGAGNPYAGIYVFFLAPLGLVAGCALCWLASEMLSAERAAAAAAAGNPAPLC